MVSVAKIHFFDDKNKQMLHFFDDKFSDLLHFFDDKIREIPHFFEDKTSYFRYSEKSVRRISPLRRKVSWKARAATIDCGS